MADYNSSLPVRTENNGDVVVKVGDATTPAQQLAVDTSGRVTANQGVPNTATNGWPVKPTDGTNSQSYTASGEALVKVNELLVEDHNYGAVGANTLRTAAEVGNATGAADFNSGATTAQTLRTASNMYDSSGNAISLTNPLPVVQSTNSGSPINDFKDATSIAAAGTDDHDYTVTAGKTLYLSQVESSASGKAKMEVQIETGVATGVFNSKFVQFNSTANPSMSIQLSEPIPVAAGVRVRIIMTNTDKAAQDLYSTISGHEN